MLFDIYQINKNLLDTREFEGSYPFLSSVVQFKNPSETSSEVDVF